MTLRETVRRFLGARSEEEQATLWQLYLDLPRSFVDLFPGVPPPCDQLTPSLLAARWTSHDLRLEDLPGIAADLLERGYDGPFLRRLAGELQLRRSFDAEPIVSRMFLEIGATYPLPEFLAKVIVTRQVAREVIHGRRNPWKAANHLESVIWLGDWSVDIPDLVNLFYLSEQLDLEQEWRRPLELLRAEIIERFAGLATLPDRDH